MTATSQPFPASDHDVAWVAEMAGRVGRQHGAGDPGQARRRGAGDHRHAGRGSRPRRGCSRGRQDLPGPGPRRLDRRQLAPHPVHARPAPLRRHRRHRVPPARRALRVPSRTGVRQRRARRRDQPGLAQNPVGPSRGHGRAAGHRRRPPPRRAPTVPGPGHPEPDRDGRYLPAARSPAGPVPGAADHGLPRQQHGGGHPGRRRLGAGPGDPAAGGERRPTCSA